MGRRNRLKVTCPVVLPLECRGLYRSPNVMGVCPPVSLPRDLDATVTPVTIIGTAQDDIEPREGYQHSKVTQLEACTLSWSWAPTTLCAGHLVGGVSDPEPPTVPHLYPRWGRAVVSSDYSGRERSHLPRAWHEEGSTCDLDGPHDELLS